MKVFVTGATGFIGSAVVRLLLEEGHDVLGLARSDASARSLQEAGAGVHRGDLRDASRLRAGAESADAVVHTGFVHDFSRYAEMCALDRDVIAALGEPLVGTDRPMLVTAGIVGTASTESDRHPPGASSVVPRAHSEEAVDALVLRGVRAGIVRPGHSVHGSGDHGFIPMLVARAKAHGRSPYVGAGENRWSAVQRSDAARVYTLALKRVTPGDRFHAVAEAVRFREIAEAIGNRLGIPSESIDASEAEAHFGALAKFAQLARSAMQYITPHIIRELHASHLGAQF